MKKAIVLTAFLFLVSSVLIAHPPSDIIITFDLANKTVTAKIMHEVKDVVDHYISQAVVMVNGKKAVTQLATTQTSNEAQTLVYVIPGLKAGDVVSVDADCIKFGDMTKEATVKAVEPAALPATNEKKVSKNKKKEK
jgi:hypothetical protein